MKAVLETLPIVTELAAGVPLLSSSGLMPDFASANGRFEGFTFEEWASYAKKKLSLASRICKQNGELKAHIASSGDICPMREDDFFDPWVGATFQCTKEFPTAAAAAAVDAWSQWIPGAYSEKVEGKLEVATDVPAIQELDGKQLTERDGEQPQGYDGEQICDGQVKKSEGVQHDGNQLEKCGEKEFSELNGKELSEFDGKRLMKFNDGLLGNLDVKNEEDDKSEEIRIAENGAEESEFKTASNNEHFKTDGSKAQHYKNESGNVDDFIDKFVTKAMDQMLRRQELQWESKIDETCRSIRSEFGLTQHDQENNFRRD